MLKQLLLIVIVVFLVSSCQPKQANDQSPVRQLVQQRFAALNRHDAGAVASQYATNALILSPNFEKPETGKQGAKNVYQRYFTTSPDMVYTLMAVSAGDSAVTVEYTFGGTMKHLEASVPAYMKDKPYLIKACEVLQLKDGRIIRDESYFDQVSFLKQMGFFEQH